MTVNIHQLIAAICPQLYCDASVRKRVRQSLHSLLQASDPLAYLKAAELAVPVEPNQGSAPDASAIKTTLLSEELFPQVTQRRFSRDAMAESLEAFYFQLLNPLTDDDQWQVTKLVDSFSPAPGSTAHPDFRQRITEAREQADRLLHASKALLKSILHDMEQVKTQQQLLRYYEDLKSEDADRQQIAVVFLKQHWLETRESQRGTMSLLRLSRQFPDHQLLSRFMNGTADKSATSAASDWLDHTLTQRLEEFWRWIESSETDLNRSLTLQRSQLKQDLHHLQLNAQWLKPLLDQANASSRGTSPHLVNAFNTMVFEVMLLAQGTSTLEEQVQRGELPKALLKPSVRRYHPILVLELSFRATRNRLPGLRGRVDVQLTSYALNEEEIAILHREFQRQQLGQTILAIDDSAHTMVDGLFKWMDESITSTGSSISTENMHHRNPFIALFSLFTRFWDWITGRSALELQPASFLEERAVAVALRDAQMACNAVIAGLLRGP